MTEPEPARGPTRIEIRKVIHDHIGVSGGYPGDFSNASYAALDADYRDRART
jgi:hypothetical protein